MDAAMNSAVSALQSQSAALSTISDNLANSQTTGYKTVSTAFESLLTTSSTSSTSTDSLLVVSGAFHSPLMEGAREGLKKALDLATIRDAEIPVYANVTAEPVTHAAEIRDLLYRQLTHPVRWEQSVRAMARDGAQAGGGLNDVHRAPPLFRVRAPAAACRAPIAPRVAR